MPPLDSAARWSLVSAALWLLAGLALEGIAAYHLLVSPEQLWWRSVPLHLMACPLLAAGLWQGLPREVARPAAGTLAFLLATLIVLPGVGTLGLALGVLPALHGARHVERAPWHALPLPELPFRAVAPLPLDDPAIRDGLGSVLAGIGGARQRQQAILACRHLPHRQAIPLLRQGLTDSADDVRLLAYSMLNAIERELDGQLLSLTRTIERHGDPDGRRAEAVSALYWEYAYLGLARGSTLHYLLEQALASIDQALERGETAQRWLQRGRLCSTMGDAAKAERAYEQCERLGMADDDIAPHRAELAFQQRRFAQVKQQLARLTPSAARHPALQPVASFWQHANPQPSVSGGSSGRTGAWQ